MNIRTLIEKLEEFERVHQNADVTVITDRNADFMLNEQIVVSLDGSDVVLSLKKE